MTKRLRLLRTGSALLLAAGIAGCVSGGQPGGGGGPRAATTGLEGDWVSTDGVAVSRFAGGVFTTSALDTGNKLADGSYRVNGRNVEITVVSLIRNSTTNVNCALVAPTQLNCTTSTGQQFVLTRRGGTV